MPNYRDGLDYKIVLKLDDSRQPPRPSSQRLRPISRDKARVVKLYVNDIVKKGHVKRSISA